MADILTQDEINALLSTVDCDFSLYDIYINKENNKEYYVLQEVLNKTNGTTIILYRAKNNLRVYARNRKDFF